MIYSNTSLKTYLSNLILSELYHKYQEGLATYPIQKYQVQYWNRPGRTQKAYHHLFTMIGQAYKNRHIYSKKAILYIDLTNHLITIKPYASKQPPQEVEPIQSHIHGMELYAYPYF